MKQKMVIRVTMTDAKSRTKALKTVVGCLGVESTALKGADKDQIEVIGEGIDPVKITTLLRKNVGYSEIVSVGPVPEKKEGDKKPGGEKEKEKSKPAESIPTVIWTTNPYAYYYNGGVPYFHEVRDSDPCSIM